MMTPKLNQTHTKYSTAKFPTRLPVRRRILDVVVEKRQLRVREAWSQMFQIQKCVIEVERADAIRHPANVCVQITNIFNSLILVIILYY